jgi:hypothetical protein
MSRRRLWFLCDRRQRMGESAAGVKGGRAQMKLRKFVSGLGAGDGCP